MASPRLCLVAACLMLVAGQAMGQAFPYCACERGGSQKSPYLMTLKSETPQPDGTTNVCYDLITVNADATGTCTAYDLRKIEFNVNVNCRGQVKAISFNGAKVAPSFTAYPDNGALVFKITKSNNGVLGTYADLSKQTNQVCYTLAAGQCSSTATFYKNGKPTFVFFDTTDNCCLSNGVLPTPSPSPPFINVPGPFPYCSCARVVPTQTYTLASAGPAVSSPKGSTYCFTLTTAQGPAGPCINYDLKKVEFNVGLECRSSVDSITFAGESVAPSYASYPAKHALVLKVTRGSRPLATHASLVGKSTPLCITLRAGSSCASFDTLSPTKLYATFSNDNRCCPTGRLV